MKKLLFLAGLVLFAVAVWFLWPDSEPLLSVEHAPTGYAAPTPAK